MFNVVLEHNFLRLASALMNQSFSFMTFSGLVKSQTNVAEHDPKFCEDKYRDWGAIPECPLPTFGPGKPQVGKTETI